jgi:hypothetical protein
MFTVNLWRFLSFVVFSLGASGMLTYLIRKAYHLYNRRRFSRYFETTFEQSFKTLTSFFDMIMDDARADAENFLIRELKRKKLIVPRRFSAMYYRLARAFVAESKKHEAALRRKDPAALERVKFGVRARVMEWYVKDFNVDSLHWILYAVPVVVTASTFFPLVIYFYVPQLLNLYPLVWGGVGLVLAVGAVIATLRDWRE